MDRSISEIWTVVRRYGAGEFAHIAKRDRPHRYDDAVEIPYRMRAPS